MIETCAKVGKVGLFYDNEMGVEERAAMAAHVAGCAVCQGELAALKGLSGRVMGMRSPGLAPNFGVGLRQRIAAQEERGLLHTAQFMMGIAALLMVVAMVGIRMIGTNGSVPVEPNPDWAVAAEHPDPDVAGGDQNVVLAQWIVDDLSTGDQR